jgi:hypothetical protein
MTIGINWKDIWNPVWKQVWSQTAPIPPTQPVRASKGNRSGGAWLVTATDYGYLVETGSGTLKLNSKYMLDLEAQNAGATLRWN